MCKDCRVLSCFSLPSSLLIANQTDRSVTEEPVTAHARRAAGALHRAPGRRATAGKEGEAGTQLRARQKMTAITLTQFSVESNGGSFIPNDV